MTAEPRKKWQYSNMMYATVGLAIEVLTASELSRYLAEKL
jgi:CubicO group peptidase (beta-lactamase class C family)